MVNMNRLTTARRKAVVAALVEGNSIRATVRMTGVAKNTIVNLLVDLGDACARYQDEHLRGLKTRHIQCDEIWSFVYAKRKNVTPEMKEQHPGAGDAWTWTALDADSKLILSFRVGTRDSATAHEFMQDVAARVQGRVQLTSDGLTHYLNAVEGAFGLDVDYAMLNKIFAAAGDQGRYSPPVCIGCQSTVVSGDPDRKHVNTSYVERQNLTMRMSMRRFTRLTNGFSKKLENHAATVALYFMYYNFARVHQTLRVTPAMQAGIADHVWSLDEIVSLLP